MPYQPRDPMKYVYGDRPKPYNHTSGLSARRARDERLFNDYINGLPVNEIMSRYDLARNSVHKIVHRHAVRTGSAIPPIKERYKARRLWKAEQRHLRRLSYLKEDIDLEDLTPSQRKRVRTEIEYIEIFLAWRKGRDVTWLSGRYSYPKVTIEWILRRLSKRER